MRRGIPRSLWHRGEEFSGFSDRRRIPLGISCPPALPTRPLVLECRCYGHKPAVGWDFIIFDDVVFFSSFWLHPRVASAFGLPGFDAAGRLVPGSAGSDICVSLAIVEFARQKWHTRVSAPLTHTSSSLFIYGCKGIWADCGGIAAKLNIAFLDDPDDMSRASCEVLHSEFCERRTK